MDSRTLGALVVLLVFVCAAMAFVVKDQMDLIKEQRKYIKTLEDGRKLLSQDLQMYKWRLEILREEKERNEFMGRRKK